MTFQITFPTKWSDFDPNRHMRHTAYNEYAAEVRVRYFKSQNFSIDEFTKHNIGPILFEEYTSFRKEMRSSTLSTSRYGVAVCNPNGGRDFSILSLRVV